MALIVGATYTASGTFTGPVDTAGEYELDYSNTWQAYASFSMNASTGKWSGSFILPAAGAHTIRSRPKNYAANTTSSASGTFTVLTTTSTNAPGLLSAVSTWNGVEMKAREARQIMGVCIETKVGKTYPHIANQLKILKTRRVREHLASGGTVITNNFVQLEAALSSIGASNPKLQVIGLITAYLNESTTPAQSVQGALDLQARGSLYAVEGPNEFDNNIPGTGTHGPNDRTQKSTPSLFPQNQLDWAIFMRDMRANNPSLANVKFLAPAISQTTFDAYSSLKNLATYVDGGTSHCYTPGGHPPDFEYGKNNDIGMFATVYNRVNTALGTLTRNMNHITECGGITAAGYFDPPSHAKMILQTCYSCRALVGPQGGGMIYTVEDGDSAENGGNNEAHFGLFFSSGYNGGGDIQPKPAALGYGKMQDCLSLNRNWDDAANLTDTASFVPAYNAQALAISGFPVGNFQVSSGQGYLVHHFSDGTTMIELAGYSPTLAQNGVAVSVPPITVTLNFGLSQGPIRKIDPLDTTYTAANTPVTLTNATTMQVQLTGHPIFIHLGAPSGYTQSGGDPRNVPQTGSSTFGIKQSWINQAPLNAYAVTVQAPAGMTPGNRVIAEIVGNGGVNVTLPPGATLIGRRQRGDQSLTVVMMTVSNAAQTWIFGGLYAYGAAMCSEAKFNTATFWGADVTITGDAYENTAVANFTVPTVPSGGVALIGYGTQDSPVIGKNTIPATSGDVSVLRYEPPTNAGDNPGLYCWGLLASAPTGGAKSVSIPGAYPTGDNPQVAGVILAP